MSWLGWAVLLIAVIGVFVLWDLVFCGGKRCRGLWDQIGWW